MSTTSEKPSNDPRVEIQLLKFKAENKHLKVEIQELRQKLQTKREIPLPVLSTCDPDSLLNQEHAFYSHVIRSLCQQLLDKKWILYIMICKLCYVYTLRQPTISALDMPY